LRRVLPKAPRQEETMSEQQRTAIVTGAAGGIGRELVLGLLGTGQRIARAVGRRDKRLAFPARGGERGGRKQGADREEQTGQRS
jgi:NAD(P)-dependent dehydrogenase (short-subunit alcohol dehydrogenase family)